MSDTFGINDDHREVPPALIASLKTQNVRGETRHVPGDDRPAFFVSDEYLEIEFSHELGLAMPAAAACERLAAALLAHASQIRAAAGAPRRLPYLFYPRGDAR